MAVSFGTRLRLRREEQGIALSAIAEDLKIKLSLLEAVERDDVTHWPSGIYRRAFIRAYAHAIGLNPDVVVREFVELHPDPEEVAAFASAPGSPTDNGPAGGGPPTRLRNIVGSAIGSLSRLGRGPAAQSPGIPRAAVAAAPSRVEIVVPSAPEPAGQHTIAGAPRDVVAPHDAVGPREAVPRVEAVPRLEGVTRGERVADAVVVESFTDVVVEPVNDDAVDELMPAVAPARVAAAEPTSPPVAVNKERSPDPDFIAVAHLCTRIGCVLDARELPPLLQEAARILDVSGLIVWLWDDTAGELRPALVHGYSDQVLAQLPTVSRDADNPTAAAFRSAQTCAILGHDQRGGALVVPLLDPEGCAGVLAMEFQDGREQTPAVHAVAMIVASTLSQLVRSARPADIPPNPEIFDDPVGKFTRPLRVRR
jgi:transcriptional regulator with XRE-family HTH domain